MEENLQTSKDTSSSVQRDTVSFLKIDALTKGSHALSVFLKTNDIIVGVDKKVFRGTQKTLNDILKEREKTAITIFRKNSFFNVLVNGPLGIKLLETSSDEDEEILKKVQDYLDKIDNFENFKEFEVFRGKGNI